MTQHGASGTCVMLALVTADVIPSHLPFFFAPLFVLSALLLSRCHPLPLSRCHSLPVSRSASLPLSRPRPYCCTLVALIRSRQERGYEEELQGRLAPRDDGEGGRQEGLDRERVRMGGTVGHGGDAERELEQDAIMHEQGHQQPHDAPDSPFRSGSRLAAPSNEPAAGGSGVEGRERADRGQAESGGDGKDEGEGGSRVGTGTWEGEYAGAGDATEDAIANALRAAREAGVELDDEDIL